MATRPITDAGKVSAAAYPGFVGQDDQEIERVLLAATELIHGMIAPRLVVADTADYAETHSGALAVGRAKCGLYLKCYPVISITAIKENGVALTFGTGYAANPPDVLVDMEQGILTRSTNVSAVRETLGAFYGKSYGLWAPGLQNVTVDYRGGWEPDQVPADLQQWCIEEAVKMRAQALAPGVDSVARSAASQQRDHRPSPMSERTRMKYASLGRPRTY